jgi:pimeloyl-ACP methyl ester carboxylesterase
MDREINGTTKSHDGATINYVYYPAKTTNPLLIMHNGVVCVDTYYAYLVKHFRGRYPMITWDYRGHGKTPVPDDLESVTVENHARDAAAVMDAVGFEKAVHLGFSMGVQVCFEFYRHFPERELGIVAICGPYGHPYDLILRSKFLGKLAAKGLGLGIPLNKIVTPIVRFFVKSPIAFPAAKIVQVDWRVKKEDMQSYFDHIGQVDLICGIHALIKMNEHTAEDVLPTVKIPTLIIAGEKDTWTPLRHQEEMHRLVPGSEFTVIPHGTHATPIENPHAVNYRIELFLRDHFKYGLNGRE